MELSWLECFVYGLISGLTEFLPISSLAHQTILLRLWGYENPALLRFCAHLGAFAALYFTCLPQLSRMDREWRLYSQRKKHRRRQPDFGKLMEMRVFRTGAVTVLLCFLGYRFVHDLYERLWILAILSAINGILLYLPDHMPGANKSAQSLSRLDSVLIGLAAGLGIVPGISSMAGGICLARTRGAERQYAVDLTLLLCIPMLLLLLIGELLATVKGGLVLSGWMIFNCFTIAIASFLSACWAVVLLRFLAVKNGYSGFAYYSWGMALFMLILYLI